MNTTMTRFESMRLSAPVLLFLLMVLFTSVSEVAAQRQLDGGVAIVLDDGTVPTPTTIRIAAPTSFFPGARADSLLFSWQWTLPIGPAPQGADVGATINAPSDDRYFLVADTAGISTWEQIYNNVNNFWLPAGNAGTTPGVGSNFVGTTDSTAFLLYANNQRVARYAPVLLGPNIIYGSDANSIITGVSGGTIAGGGSAANPNEIDDAGTNFDNFASVGGGEGNRVRSGASQDAVGGSVPGGFDNLVTREDAVAVGDRNTASGPFAVALGRQSTAGGSYSFAAGRNVTASASWSTALGDSVTASGNRSLALNKLTTASGQWSLATNRATVAGSNHAFAFGDSTTASSNVGLAGGYAVTATGGSNRMVLGRGLQSSSRLTNSTNNSLFVGFNDVGSAAGNNAALAVVGANVGVGTTSPGSRLTVQASTNTGAGLPVGVNAYALDVHDVTNNVLGSHLFVLHSPNVGHYNPGGAASANGAIIGIGDPLNGALNTGIDGADPTTAADTARLVIRGWGTTDASYALLVEDSGGVDPLFGIRDDGKMLLKTAVVDDFDGFNFNGDVGPSTSGIRDAANTFDLGSCDFEFRDAYIGRNVRFDYGRAILTHDGTNDYFEMQVVDTSVIGTVSTSQTSDNGSWTPPAVLGVHSASQTLSAGGTGAIDSIDIYLDAFTPSSPMTVTVSDGSNSTSLTITTPAVSAAGYLSFSLDPLNLNDACSESLTWTLESPQPFTIAIEDRTPCVTGNSSDRARFDYDGDQGWSNTSGAYGGGSADITTAAGGTAPVVQYDTLCGAGNAGYGNCFTGGTLCGAPGTSSPTSFIQENPQNPGNTSAISVNTFPIDYRFRVYRVKTPSTALAIETGATTNYRTRIGQGSAAPDGQLDVQSETGAVIVPRMTAAQRLALPAITGSIVYQTDAPAAGAGAGTTQGIYGYDGSIPGWKLL